jgi:RimJ/RimL family protein N-acetyltransferase
MALLKLREATPGDCRILFEWRNDPLTRQNSLNVQPVNWEEHQIWLQKSLISITRKIRIAEIDENPVAVIRLDQTNDAAGYLLSWTVSPAWRGKGVGSEMLALVCREFAKFELRAEIRSSNAASRSMVQKCGFKLAENCDDIEIWHRNQNPRKSDKH